MNQDTVENDTDSCRGYLETKKSQHVLIVNTYLCTKLTKKIRIQMTYTLVNRPGLVQSHHGDEA